MDQTDLVDVLQARERELHQRTTRASRDSLDQLLHDDFIEFGRAGTRFNKAVVMTHLPQEQRAIHVHAQEFEAREIAPGIAQLTYKSAHRKDDGTLERHTLRSSLWVRDGAVWRLYFHQGTPTAAFVVQTA